MTVIGITGPTGAGKTTALNAVAELGGEVLDCDAIYHGLIQSCEPMLRDLRKRFGPEIFDECGALKRKRLGEIVFDDLEALEDLNKITHHYVRKSVESELKRAKDEGKIAAAIDAIALFESGLGELCDFTVAVTASDEVRVRRIMARDGIDEEYARLRISAQKPGGWFEERCDFVLRNEGDDPAAAAQKAKELFGKQLTII